MKETEDRKIVDKIRQVFEDFEDASSEQGWQELRKKYPESSKRPLLIWFSSAAALLLILSGLWLLDSRDTQEVVVNKNQATEDLSTADSIHVPDNPEVIRIAPTADHIINEYLRANRSKDLPNEIKHEPEKILPEENSVSIAEYTLAKQSETIKSQSFTMDTLTLAMAKLSLLTPLKDLTANNLLPLENNKESSEKNNNKGLSFSLYAGSYFNYAEGSESDLNFGAGFSSDIRLSRNLKFSTGLNLAKNSLRYDQDIPVNADKSFQSSVPSGNVNLITISNYNAELLSLDIPINIKYIISPDKNNVYILAGLSSGTYLRETYGVEYRSFSTASGKYINQGQGQQIKKQLQDFDLARTLNVSLGFSTRLSKTQNITIEPFLKYPLGGLGTENLKFGSSGINLKLNFNSLKK